MLAMSDGELLRGFRSTLNFTDRAYLIFFIVISALLLFRTHRVPARGAMLFVNLVCAFLVLLLAVNARNSSVWRFFHNWYPLGMFIVGFEEVSRLSVLFVDQWKDRYLLHVEASVFAVPPTVWLGQFGSPLVTEVMEIGYFSYFVLLIIVGGVLYVGEDYWSFRQVMDATVLGYMMCYLVFILFPTEGPAYTLAAQHHLPIPGGGPFHWAITLIQNHAGVHGNAFPSAHVAGGVVSLIFAWRYTSKLGLALTPLVVLLCLGAVYDRYHYVSDVVVGVAFGAVPSAVVLAAHRRRWLQRWFPAP